MKKKIDKISSDPAIAHIYETEIEFVCPVRGKVKQKVKVKRYQSINPEQVNETLSSQSIAEKLDKQCSGLVMDDDLLEEEGN